MGHGEGKRRVKGAKRSAVPLTRPYQQELPVIYRKGLWEAVAEMMTDIAKEQFEVVTEFLDKLFSDDVVGYWNTISKVDQARVYGMYISAVHANPALENTLTFRDYIRNYIQPDQREIFEPVQDNRGISNKVRYTDEGEALIYVLENVKVPRVHIAPTEDTVYRVTLTVDAHMDGENVTGAWKVRLYRDQHFKNL